MDYSAMDISNYSSASNNESSCLISDNFIMDFLQNLDSSTESTFNGFSEVNDHAEYLSNFLDMDNSSKFNPVLHSTWDNTTLQHRIDEQYLDWIRTTEQASISSTDSSTSDESMTSLP